MCTPTEPNPENKPDLVLSKEAHFKRLFWRSRRGLLELDLFLPDFLTQCYAELAVEQQLAYETLLTCEDPDILSWLNGHTESDDPSLQAIIEIIRSWNMTRC